MLSFVYLVQTYNVQSANISLIRRNYPALGYLLLPTHFQAFEFVVCLFCDGFFEVVFAEEDFLVKEWGADANGGDSFDYIIAVEGVSFKFTAQIFLNEVLDVPCLPLGGGLLEKIA